MCLHINHKIAILHIKRYIVAGSSRAMYMSPFLLWRRTVGQRTVGRSTVGQRTVGRRTVGRRTLWRRTLGRLSNRDGWTLWRKRWLYSSIIMGKRVMTNCDFRHWRHFVANGENHSLSWPFYLIMILNIVQLRTGTVLASDITLFRKFPDNWKGEMINSTSKIVYKWNLVTSVVGT